MTPGTAGAQDALMWMSITDDECQTDSMYDSLESLACDTEEMR